MMQGDSGEANTLVSLFDPDYDWKNDNAPQKAAEI